MSEQTKPHFLNIDGNGHFANCTNINPRLFAPKNMDKEQVVDLKFEVEITPERFLDSHLFNSAFIETTAQGGGKQGVIGGKAKESKRTFMAPPGDKVAFTYKTKDMAIEIPGADNPELFAELCFATNAKPKSTVVRLHPKHGISLTMIELDPDKSTLTPKAKLILSVKGLPSNVAAVEWLLKRFQFNFVGKDEAEVEVENKYERVARGAKGQTELTATPEDA